MFIRVRSSQGQEFIAEISSDQTVSQLKSAISGKANGLPIERQTLVYMGRTMQDTNQIRDYNLEDNCEIQLIAMPASSFDHVSPSSSNQPRTNDNSPYQRSMASPMTTPTKPEISMNRSISRFEILLREKLGVHFSQSEIEKIMANLRREINTDINSSSLDDLERLAKQKLNISNE